MSTTMNDRLAAAELAIRSVSQDEETVELSPTNVTIAGNSIVRPGVCISGDLAKVRLGRYCEIGRDAVLRPPDRVDAGGESSFVPVAVGSHVQIGNGAVVEAAWIGVGVRIGANAVIGKSTVIKDFCVVGADSVVPEDSVLAPLSIVFGKPAKLVGYLPPGAVAMRRREAERRIRRQVHDGTGLGPFAAR